MSCVVADQFIHAFAYLLAVCEVGIVGSIEVEEVRVVVAVVMRFVLLLALEKIAVKLHKSVDEVADLGSQGVLVEGDVGVVEKILVEDALAVEDLLDVGFVLEIEFSELL